MNNTEVLIQIYENIDVFMLIFVRMLAFFMIVPVIGGTTSPSIVRIGISLAIASIVYTSNIMNYPVYYDTVFEYFILIFKEFIVGLIIGLVVYFIFNATYIGGHFTDQQMGYSMSNVYDPISNTQVPITGNMYYLALCALFIISNGHHFLINSLFYSYDAIPIGKALLLSNQYLFNNFLYLVVEFFKIGVTLAMPIIGVVLVTDIALGVMVRAVPKMNVFVVGMPLKVLVGLFSVLVILPAFIQIFYTIYDLITQQVINIIRVMMQ